MAANKQKPAGANGLPPSAYDDDRFVAPAEIERALGLTVQQALDLDDWDKDSGFEALCTQVNKHITGSVRREVQLQGEIRNQVLRQLNTFPNAPAEAGVYTVDEKHLRDAYRNLLLRGEVAAVDGACIGHDSLVATLVSIGLSMVRYDGDMQSWKTTFLRHDYDIANATPMEDIRSVLDRRARRSRGSPGGGNRRDHLHSLLKRGFMAAAERKTLLQMADSRWRLGHGLPVPLEVLVGSVELVEEMLPVLNDLFLAKNRWVFIPEMMSNRAFAMLANSLNERELGIFAKGNVMLEEILHVGHFPPEYKTAVRDFAKRAGDAMVVGGFRATRHASGQVFVAHAENAIPAGILAMADAALQPFRGFPLLLDLAALSAKVGLGIEAFRGVVELAYVQAGATDLLAPERILVGDGNG